MEKGTIGAALRKAETAWLGKVLRMLGVESVRTGVDRAGYAFATGSTRKKHFGTITLRLGTWQGYTTKVEAHVEQAPARGRGEKKVYVETTLGASAKAIGEVMKKRVEEAWASIEAVPEAPAPTFKLTGPPKRTAKLEAAVAADLGTRKRIQAAPKKVAPKPAAAPKKPAPKKPAAPKAPARGR